MKKTRPAAATTPTIIGMPTRLAPPLNGTIAVALLAELPVAMALFAERPVGAPDGAGAVAPVPKLVGYGGPLGLAAIVGGGSLAGWTDAGDDGWTEAVDDGWTGAVDDGATTGLRVTPTLLHSCITNA